MLTGIEDITSEALDSLFDAGCDDGTLSSRSGLVYLTFTREAPTLRDALLSAIRDVRSAGLGVLRIDVCTLVTKSEIARKSHRSRQLIGQLIAGERGPGHFPPPVCNLTEGHPLWYWCDVAAWLHENNFIREEDLHDAQTLAVINSVLEVQHQKHLDPQLTEELLGLLES
ncbi:MAG: hypothetical protein JOZ63_02480 [Planctomycetaceae bacterium]|nr:hypothetical protein [Planctomycetaceae bacterium]